MLKLCASFLLDLLRSRILLAYALLLSVMGWGVFLLESQPEKALLLLLQMVLLVIPVVCMVFSAAYYYHAQEFILLLLAQPIERGSILGGLMAALCLGCSLAYVLGLGLPALFFFPSKESLLLLGAGGLLGMAFIALALLLGTHIRDKARGIGAALAVLAFFALLFDGLLLFLMYQFADYPMEKAILALSFFNPLDVARIAVIMKSDAAALLGLSGAVFREFFGTSSSLWISLAALVFWVLIPYGLARRRFVRMDF